MKVVIVKEIEKMPTDCDSCPFQDYDRNCGILGEYTMLNYWMEDAPYYDLVGKGDCPLKTLPQMREPNEEWLNEYHRDEFADGWNACLKELEK